MSARRFDRQALREGMSAAGVTQRDVAEGMRVSQTTVSNWVLGMSKPGPEKLARLAAVVKMPLHVLAPRGPGGTHEDTPNLTDLRCDAGFTREQASRLIARSENGSLKYAEIGARPLDDAQAMILAEAYGVTMAEFRAAEQRSTGKDVPPVPTIKKKLASWIHGYCETPPSDAEIAQRGGAPLTEKLVNDLRSGAQPEADLAVREALGRALNMPLLYLDARDPAMERAMINAELVKRDVSTMAARGDGTGMTSELLDYLAGVLAAVPQPMAREGENDSD